jgi:hypothetical protein
LPNNGFYQTNSAHFLLKNGHFWKLIGKKHERLKMKRQFKYDNWAEISGFPK